MKFPGCGQQADNAGERDWAKCSLQTNVNCCYRKNEHVEDSWTSKPGLLHFNEDAQRGGSRPSALIVAKSGARVCSASQSEGLGTEGQRGRLGWGGYRGQGRCLLGIRDAANAGGTGGEDKAAARPLCAPAAAAEPVIGPRTARGGAGAAGRLAGEARARAGTAAAAARACSCRRSRCGGGGCGGAGHGSGWREGVVRLGR
jgi:hypothetical protein